jgi:ABC-2 type transport system permease protein
MNKLFKSLLTIRGFIKKEFSQILRDPKMRIVLFVLPVVQMIVFAVAISTEVKNIKIGFQYSISDSEFIQIIDHVEKSGWFKVVPLKLGDDIALKMKNGELDAVLFAPLDKTSKDHERDQNGYQLIIDGTNLIRAQSVERYVSTILSNKIMGQVSPPLSLSIRTLYNPEMRSPYFLIPGTMAMIVGLITVLLTSMSLSREKEMGTLEMILVSPISSFELILGKTIPFLILGIINAITILFFAIVIFRVPMNGSYFLLSLSVFAFVFSTVNVGTFISTFAKNQQQAMLGGFIFLFVANLLAGIMFPIDNMPAIMKLFVNINPLKFYVEILRGLMLKDASSIFVIQNIFALFAIGFGFAYLSYRRMQKFLS